MVIIELKYKHDAQKGIDQIRERRYFEKFRKNHDLALIGLNVNEDKSVDMKVELILKVTVDHFNPYYFILRVFIIKVFILLY